MYMCCIQLPGGYAASRRNLQWGAVGVLHFVAAGAQVGVARKMLSQQGGWFVEPDVSDLKGQPRPSACLLLSNVKSHIWQCMR